MLIDGEYTPEERKEVEAQDSQDYDKDGFTGKLEKYLYSGELTPAHTKNVTNQISSNYNDSDGYVGTLSRYLHSGSYTAADTKYVTGQTSRNYSSGGYSGTLSSYVYSGSYTPADSKTVTSGGGTFTWGQWCGRDSSGNTTINYNAKPSYAGSISYNSGGYSGTLYYSEWSIPRSDARVDCEPMNPGKYVATRYKAGYEYRGTVTKPASDTRTYRYQGNVTKPAVDTRSYRYQGDVTRPEIDTREYRYKGEVIKPESDIRTYDNYYQYKIKVNYK